MVKNLPAMQILIPGWGRSPGKGKDYPLQCSCLGNPMDRGAWWATIHRVTKRSHDCSDKGDSTFVLCLDLDFHIEFFSGVPGKISWASIFSFSNLSGQPGVDFLWPDNFWFGLGYRVTGEKGNWSDSCIE